MALAWQGPGDTSGAGAILKARCESAPPGGGGHGSESSAVLLLFFTSGSLSDSSQEPRCPLWKTSHPGTSPELSLGFL